jgi:hypothetical protein
LDVQAPIGNINISQLYEKKAFKYKLAPDGFGSSDGTAVPLEKGPNLSPFLSAISTSDAHLTADITYSTWAKEISNDALTREFVTVVENNARGKKWDRLGPTVGKKFHNEWSIEAISNRQCREGDMIRKKK